MRGGVVHLTPGKWPAPAATPTSRPKPRGVSSAIDGGARHDHGLVRRGGSPAETRPARYPTQLSSDSGADGGLPLPLEAAVAPFAAVASLTEESGGCGY